MRKLAFDRRTAVVVASLLTRTVDEMDGQEGRRREPARALL